MTGKLKNAQNSTVIKRKKINQILKNTQTVPKQAVSHGHPEWNLTYQCTTNNTMQKQEWINSFWWSATCGRKMGKCGVFIPSHSHQAIPILISVPMKLALRFPFPWESHGTHRTQYIGGYSSLVISIHKIQARAQCVWEIGLLHCTLYCPLRT